MFNIPVYFVDKMSLDINDPWGVYFYLTKNASSTLKNEIRDMVCCDSVLPMAGLNNGNLINSVPDDSLLCMADRDKLYNNNINPVIRYGSDYCIFGNKIHKAPYPNIDRINQYKILYHLENFTGNIIDECKYLCNENSIFDYRQEHDDLYIRFHLLDMFHCINSKYIKRKLKYKNYKKLLNSIDK
jgi:hypothetical protein